MEENKEKAQQNLKAADKNIGESVCDYGVAVQYSVFKEELCVLTTT